MKNLVLLLCLFLAAHLTIAGGAHGQTQTADSSATELGLPAYETKLDNDAKLLRSIKDQPAEISRFRTVLPATWIVDTDHGKIKVSTEWLDTALLRLQSHPKDSDAISRDIASRLSEMREAALALETYSSPSTNSDEKAREKLAVIFQRKEFGDLHGPSAWERWGDRVGRWVGEKILWLFQHIHVRANSGNFLAWSVIAIAFLALCYWAYRSLSRSARNPRLPAIGPAPPSDARTWSNDAVIAAERGDYREAVHCAYWAAVSKLEDIHLLKRDRARTPRESLRLLHSHPDLQNSLRELTGHFELIWYGYRPATATDWSSARIQLERMGCLKPSTAATVNS